MLERFFKRRKPEGEPLAIDPNMPKLVRFEDGVWTFQSPAFPAMIATAAAMLDETEAPNYVEFQAQWKRSKWIVCCIQRREGKTPHQLRQEAEAKCDTMLDAIKTIGRDAVDVPNLGPGFWISDEDYERLMQAARLAGA
jgi:hypothetical protein